MIHLPIFNQRLGQFAFENYPLTLREAICIANREAAERQFSCNDCRHLGSESDGGEPEYAVSWPICEKFPRYEHLKSFPFKRAPKKCFSLDFFASAYVDAADFERMSQSDDGNDLDAALEAWRNADEFGRFIGPDRAELDRMAWEGGAA